MPKDIIIKRLFRLPVAGPNVAQLEVFFSLNCLGVMSPFLCFIIVC